MQMNKNKITCESTALRSSRALPVYGLRPSGREHTPICVLGCPEPGLLQGNRGLEFRARAQTPGAECVSSKPDSTAQKLGRPSEFLNHSVSTGEDSGKVLRTVLGAQKRHPILLFHHRHCCFKKNNIA